MTYGYGSGSAIIGIGTALPPHRLSQEDAAQRVAQALDAQAGADRRTRRLFRQCGVETRYTCEPSFAAATQRSRYLSAIGEAPSTKERGDAYRQHALPLALKAARRALEDSGISASYVTHLFAVSCTGMYLPGLDSELVRHLGLPRDVQRLPLSFVGCSAGLKAIGIAAGIVAQQSEARALVVCVELCTLHVQPGAGRDELLAAAMFGDGAAACVVGAAEAAGAAGVAGGIGTAAAAGAMASVDARGPGLPKVTASFGRRGYFRLGRYRSVLLDEGGGDMTWVIGDNGFELVLSPRIPELLVKLVPQQLSQLTADMPRPQLWAIHPGGRGILDALQQLYQLSGRQLEPSREVLRSIGNVSSATILFVLDELRRSLDAGGMNDNDQAGGQLQGGEGCGVALAFGPGLTAELLTFDYIASSGLTRTQEVELDARAVSS